MTGGNTNGRRKYKERSSIHRQENECSVGTQLLDMLLYYPVFLEGKS